MHACTVSIVHIHKKAAGSHLISVMLLIGVISREIKPRRHGNCLGSLGSLFIPLCVFSLRRWGRQELSRELYVYLFYIGALLNPAQILPLTTNFVKQKWSLVSGFTDLRPPASQ